jgi:hypothetical protein
LNTGGRQLGAARSQCDEEDGHPMTRREFNALLGGAATDRHPDRYYSQQLGTLGMSVNNSI